MSKFNVTRPRKLSRVMMGVVSLFVLTIGFSFGPGAGIASATAHCASGEYVCLYDDANFGGSVLRMSLPGPSSCRNIPYAWADNMATSLANAGTHEIYLYENTGCSGALVWMGPASEISDLSGYPALNNRISSVKRIDF